jgi:hypothetical protein
MDVGIPFANGGGLSDQRYVAGHLPSYDSAGNRAYGLCRPRPSRRMAS